MGKEIKKRGPKCYNGDSVCGGYIWIRGGGRGGPY